MHYAFERASFLLIPLLVTVFQIAFSYIFFFIFNIFSFSLICIMDHDGNGFGMDELWRILFFSRLLTWTNVFGYWASYGLCRDDEVEFQQYEMKACGRKSDIKRNVA